jgi:hypothetical protein
MVIKHLSRDFALFNVPNLRWTISLIVNEASISFSIIFLGMSHSLCIVDVNITGSGTLVESGHFLCDLIPVCILTGSSRNLTAFHQLQNQ